LESFDVTEFMDGARAAYPLVSELMLNMDPDDSMVTRALRSFLYLFLVIYLLLIPPAPFYFGVFTS